MPQLAIYRVVDYCLDVTVQGDNKDLQKEIEWLYKYTVEYRVEFYEVLFLRIDKVLLNTFI